MQLLPLHPKSERTSLKCGCLIYYRILGSKCLFKHGNWGLSEGDPNFVPKYHFEVSNFYLLHEECESFSHLDHTVSLSDNILPMAVAFSAVDLMGSTTISPKVRKDFPETWIWELFPDLGLVYPVFYGFISLGRSLLLSLLHSFICK